jgi:CO/xanthine dehydrogenase Mo-binding subunit
VPLRNSYGSGFFIAPHPVLARDAMRYVGEPVTTVVDRTFAAATDAVSASSPVKMYANLFNPSDAG